MNNNTELQTYETAPPSNTTQNDLSVDAVRAAKEVEASMIVAQKFPRDINQAFNRIIKSCQRKSMAEQAVYRYPRGGQLVEGPSIRMAEMLAQFYGNLQFGLRELSQNDKESVVQAYCFDIETNTRVEKTYTVPHIRYSKSKGNTKLTDPRDIYEMVANQGARRLRACILSIIPIDIVEAAVEECKKTLLKGNGEPFEDKVRKMIIVFDQLGVKQSHIEDFLKHPVDEIDGNELLDLKHIFLSIKDGVATRGDYFKIDKTEAKSANADALSQAVNGSAAAPPSESTTNQGESDTTQNTTTNLTSDSKKSSTSKSKKSEDKSDKDFDLK